MNITLWNNIDLLLGISFALNTLAYSCQSQSPNRQTDTQLKFFLAQSFRKAALGSNPRNQPIALSHFQRPAKLAYFETLHNNEPSARVG